MYVWTDSLWVNDHNVPAIILYGRRYDDKFKTVKTIIRGFRPYFYVPENVGTTAGTIDGVRYSVGSTTYTDALGRKVRRAYVKLPSDVPKVRDRFEFTDEADILFDKRFLIDKGITYAYKEDGNGVIPVTVPEPLLPRIMFFDIEVHGIPGKVPQPAQADRPIITIQALDTYTNEIVVFTQGIDKVDERQICCTCEADLLVKFVKYVEDNDFDVLSGWYTNGFDLPYIINRARNLGVSLKGLGRTYSEPSCEKTGTGWRIRIPGRQCFDLLEAFRKYYAPQGQLDSYDLKSIVGNKDIIGNNAFTYVDYGPYMDKLLNDGDYSTLIDYCIKDVQALNVIDGSLRLIAFFEHLRMIAGVKLEETLMNSRVIESLIMHGGIKPMPTKKYDVTTDGFEGALVLTPPAGIHDNVGVVDLAALYPNIMVGFNISPDIDGVIPRTLRIIMQEREKLRRLKLEGKASTSDKNKETVLKYLANSFYGVIGWPRFRLYNQEQAATVTRIGRELNQFLQEVMHEAGYESIYGDTDSLFVKGIKTPDDGLALQDYANKRLEEWSVQRGSSVMFTLKFEKLYRRIVFKKAISGEVAKKRYAGHIIWKDGQNVNKLDYTGIELKRSDQAHITKDILKQFLEDVLLNGDSSIAINRVRKLINDIRAGNVSVHDVSIPKGVSITERNDPWIHGMQLCRELFGMDIPSGVKPRLIYLNGDRKYLCIYEDMDEGDIRSKVDIDWDTCMNKTIERKLRTYVESIGLHWDQVIGGQSTLI